MGLHVAAAPVSSVLGDEAVAVLVLQSPASLGRWFSSTLLGLAAGTAMFIYALRRHRLDDYHGRYRVWISAALGCLLLSIAESTGLIALARAVVRLGTDWGHVRFEIAWSTAITLLAAAAGIRLAIEIRRCGPALASLALAMLCFTVAAAIYWQWPISIGERVAPLWGRGSWLAAYVMLQGTFILYARRVQLEVAGTAALPARKRRSKPVHEHADAAVQQAPPRKTALKLRTDLDPVEIIGSQKKNLTEQQTNDATAVSAAVPIDTDATRKRLSKADRRRMARETRMAS